MTRRHRAEGNGRRAQTHGLALLHREAVTRTERREVSGRSTTDLQFARALQSEAFALARTLADEHGTAVSLNSLGYPEFSEGKYLAAEGVLTGALDQFRTLEDPVGIALSLFGLANLAATQRRRHASRGLVRPESG
jgi:DNA transposition AAA+ family ATPase